MRGVFVPQIIQSNPASLNVRRHLAGSQGVLLTALQRLSSGLRINGARDDAAGLAIATRFTTQILGFAQAARNANDGISLAQTAEGALAEVSENLQRIRELSVQSRNATNSDADRAALDAEVQQRLAEVNRVARQTQFNGLKLLDGSFISQSFQIGADAGQTVTLNALADITGSGLGFSGGTLMRYVHAGTAVTAALDPGDLTVNGSNVGAVAGDAQAIAAAINALDARYGAVASNAQTGIAFVAPVGTLATPVTSATLAMGAFTMGTGGAAGSAFTLTFATGDAGESLAVSASSSGGNTTALDIHNAFLNAGFNADGSGTVAGYTLNLGVSVNISQAVSNGTLTVRRADGDNFTYTSATAGPPYGAAPSFATASGAGSADGIEAVTAVAPAYSLLLNGGALDLGAAGADGTVTGAEVAALIDALDGYTASFALGTLSIARADGANFTLSESGADAATAGLAAASTTYRGAITMTSAVPVAIAGAAPAKAGLVTAAGTATPTAYAQINVRTAAASDTALEVLDLALTSVASTRAQLGALQNRFSSVIANLQSTRENLMTSRSRVLDADYAQEIATLTRAQILQQAGTAMLAQANRQPQTVLALLR